MTRELRPAFAAVLITLGLVVSGCRPETEEVAPEPEPAPTAEIAWFEGSVEEALALAKEERRPVFLYWGAEWCPPCHALRTKLFTQPEFVERLDRTVPVYLDGDTARAQIWGERLNTYGYPTVILLDADGNEITRVQGTLPVKEYGQIVTDAIESSRPIVELVAAVDSEGVASLNRAELRRLAFYSYGQDQALDLDLEERRALFAKLEEGTPEELEAEKTRFAVLELMALATSNDETPAADLDDAHRRELIAETEKVLGDPELRSANLDMVLYGATGVVELLTPEPGDGRDELVAAWLEATDAIRDDESLSTDDRLKALYPRLGLATIDSPPSEEEGAAEIPTEVQQEVRDGVRWASARVTSEDEMQAVMSTMAGLLTSAGLNDEAETLLAERASETTAPYYFLGWLASLKADAGATDEAVGLYRQAWLAAKESTSRTSMSAFRWGSAYLRRAMEHTPDDVSTIGTDAETIVGDLLAGPDAFAGGNWSLLEGLGETLASWENDVAARADVVVEVESMVRAACPNSPDPEEDSAAARCRSFLGDDPSDS